MICSWTSLLQPVEELQFVWCELLSEALAALWSSSVTSDPDRWLKWDPLRPESLEAPKRHSKAEHMVSGLQHLMLMLFCLSLSCSIMCAR